MDYVSGDINISGKSILDVGAGGGQLSEYFLRRDAGEVVALEPEDAGSDYAGADFDELQKRGTEYDSLKAVSTTFQGFDPDTSYDLVVLHNVINHLNESSVRSLHKNQAARETFRGIIEDLAKSVTRGGQLIICDSGRSGLWRHVPISLFDNIEWNKHQDPDVWVGLFTEYGFEREVCEWTPIFGHGGVVRRLTGNKLAAFVRTAHFRLVFTYNPPVSDQTTCIDEEYPKRSI